MLRNYERREKKEIKVTEGEKVRGQEESNDEEVKERNTRRYKRVAEEGNRE